MDFIGVDVGSDSRTTYCIVERLNDDAVFIKEYGELRKREVSAKRKRKLRWRGEHCKFERRTETGKARYSWWMKTPNV